MSDTHNSDQAFILALTEIVIKNLKNENFRIKALAREAGLSSSTLNRRLNRIHGKSGNEFIRELRLRKAHEMLQDKSVNVSEVSFAVGFSSPAYFSACFHEYFGYPPSKVSKEIAFSPADENIEEQSGFEKQTKTIHELLKEYRSWIFSFFLAAAGVIIFLYVKTSGSSSPDDLRSDDGRIPVAVMPFDNLTGNKTWDCIQMNLISYLSNFEELKVCQKEDVDFLLESRGTTGKASITPGVASYVSRKLNSRIYISGVISQAGSSSRINVQMVNSKTGVVIQSFQVEDDSDENKIFGMMDSVSTLVKDFLVTSKMIREAHPDLRPYSYTNSPVAFKYFIQADDANQKRDLKTSLSLYLKTVEADSCFIPAIIFLSMRYKEMGDYKEAIKWCLRAYSLKENAHLKDRYMIEWYHAVLLGTPEEELRFLMQYASVDDNVPIVHWMMGNAYAKLEQYADAIPEYEEALEIYRKWDVRPMMINNYLTLIEAFHKTHQFKKEKKLIGIAAKTFPEDAWMLGRCRAILAYSEKDTISGNRYVDEYRAEMTGKSVPVSEINSEIVSLCIETGNIEEAENCAREACSRYPGNPEILNKLAYLLIDKELNVSEGLRLATEGLKIKPGDPYLLHTLGWGMAKTGKYTEALEILNISWQTRHGYDKTLLQQIEEVRKHISILNQVI